MGKLSGHCCDTLLLKDLFTCINEGKARLRFSDAVKHPVKQKQQKLALRQLVTLLDRITNVQYKVFRCFICSLGCQTAFQCPATEHAVHVYVNHYRNPKQNVCRQRAKIWPWRKCVV